MENEKAQSSNGCIIVREDQLDEEGKANLLAFIKLLLEIDAELAAKGQSPIQHIHDQHARERADKEAKAATTEPSRRRNKKSRPVG